MPLYSTVPPFSNGDITWDVFQWIIHQNNQPFPSRSYMANLNWLKPTNIFGWLKINQKNKHISMGISGSNLWRYCTIFLAIFWGYIPLYSPYIGLIDGRYLQKIGSWNGHWTFAAKKNHLPLLSWASRQNHHLLPSVYSRVAMEAAAI
jgi:hypothetical protein